MSKVIIRTIRRYRVMIKDTRTHHLIESYEQLDNPDKKEIAKKFIRKTGNMDFYITVDVKLEKRKMSIETFILHSEKEK